MRILKYKLYMLSFFNLVLKPFYYLGYICIIINFTMIGDKLITFSLIPLKIKKELLNNAIKKLREEF